MGPVELRKERAFDGEYPTTVASLVGDPDDSARKQVSRYLIDKDDDIALADSLRKDLLDVVQFHILSQLRKVLCLMRNYITNILVSPGF